MRNFVSRRYRERMGGRFRSFSAAYEETDLWIGVDPASYAAAMEDFAAGSARRHRLELEAYIARRPEFRASLVPIALDPEAPELARDMMVAAALAGVGPMAAVAGATAEAIGREIVAEFGCRELVVENGGDLWLLFEEPLEVSVFAGPSPLSDRVGVSISPNFSPLGLCTSSGTVGPSLSLGRADAAMVACRGAALAAMGAAALAAMGDAALAAVGGAALADALATKLGNAVLGPGDIEAALDLALGVEGAVSALAVVGDRMGIRGELPLKLFSA